MTTTSSVQAPTTPLGLQPQGLSIWRQTDWQQSLEFGFQQAFGPNAQLGPQSINGQLINIFAERMALLTELVESIYQSQYPAGAQGVAVDNQLALVGLTRKIATPTVTDPNPVSLSTGVTLYGLVLYGTAGTVVPAGTLLADASAPPNTFTLDSGVTIAGPQNAQQAMVLSAQATSGVYALTLTAPGGTALTTAAIDYRALANQTQLIFPTGASSFTLTANGETTATLEPDDDPSAMASALNTALGLATITAGQGSLGVVMNWPAGAIPQLSASGTTPPTVVQPVQAQINALTYGSILPFTDVAVSGGYQALTIAFGANSPTGSNPSTAAQAIALATVASSTLQASSSAVNIGISTAVAGQPAQGIGSATCTATGPVSIATGALSVIQTPLQGLSAVTNQIPCIPGQLAETDSQALQRRAAELSASAQGPLAAVLQKVENLSGVTTALAFQNTSNAAQQLILFAGAPTQGTYQLALGAGTTASLPFSAAAADLQSAIRALPRMDAVLVTGSSAYGFRIDYNGAEGGQAQPLVQVVSNTTDATVQTAFGRPGHSLEVVVEGGSNDAVAQTILASAPAGVATYGAATGRPTISAAQGSTTVTVSSAAGLAAGQTLSAPCLPYGCTIVTFSGLSLTMSAAAIATASNQAAKAGYFEVVSDSQGNELLVSFSRPQVVDIYVQVAVITDQYLVPGNSASGVNPNSKWQPGSIATLQADVVSCLSAIPIGGTIVGLGTNGVISSITAVPGMYSYTLTFGATPNPTNTAPITLLESQLVSANVFNVSVSYT